MKKIELTKNDIILFEGDSVTDALRDRSDLYSLAGYSKFIAQSIPCICYNRGVGGDTAYQVLQRVEKDLQEVKPTVFSLLIGVNDTWRRFDSNILISPEETSKNIVAILEIAKKYVKKIIIMEPFLLDVDKEKRKFREDLAPRIWAVRDIARSYQLPFVPLNGIFAEKSCEVLPDSLSYDGVHPTEKGHQMIAEEWLKRINFQEGEKNE
jgi:acyl-CoA thioesterase-1